MSDIVRHTGTTGMSIIDAAKAAEASGMLPPKMTWQGAAWIMQTGAELGFGPAQSMRLLYVVQNRVTLSADGAVALVMRSYPNWRFEYKTDAGSATVKVYDEQGRERANVTFTLEDAKAAGLLGKGGPWQQYPKQMLLARAKAYAARMAAPDAVGGLYSPEEMGADVDRSGAPKQTTITSFEPDAEPEPDPEDEIGPKPGAVFRDTGSPGDKPLSTDAIDLLKDAMAAAGVQVKAFKEWTDKEGINRERLTVKDGAMALCWVIANTAQGGDPTPAIDLHVQLTGRDPVIDAEEQ